MGQTLSHGVYLPAEGERNCYSGLASNWNLLDTAIGDTAGKASASHTHGNITNAGAIGSTSGLPVITGTDGILTTGTFGTAAGTICEGNDSRLSDARTPVAHTHTKSDVTDLFNSNFVPSANNSYDLGSSSYQWNNLYAKNYYYNGVAWGLDKVNTWTTDQIIQNASIGLKNTSISQGSSATTGGSAITLIDKNNQSLSSISTRVTSASRTIIELKVQNTYKNGVLSTDSDAELIVSSWYFGQLWNGTSYYILTGLCDSDIIPKDNNSKNLGTSNLKWKTLNGINPGALSLPDMNTSTAVDTTGWTYDGATFNEIKINNATQTISGWLYIIINNAAADDVIVVRYAGSDSSNLTYAQYKSGLSYVSLVAPIMPGVKTYVASRKAFSTIKIYHSLGNV